MNRSRILFAAVLLLAPGALRADCPDGARNTTEAERADFINGMNELKAAVPAAPAGWQLQAPAIPYVTAPATTCKGSKLFAAYSFTYTSTDQQKQLQERIHDRETRIAALSKLSPDEQKQFDDLRHQGSQLGYQSIAAQKAISSMRNRMRCGRRIRRRSQPRSTPCQTITPICIPKFMCTSSSPTR